MRGQQTEIRRASRPVAIRGSRLPEAAGRVSRGGAAGRGREKHEQGANGRSSGCPDRPARARPASRVQHLNVDWLARVPAGEQPMHGPRKTPVDTQNAEQLRRQHDVAVLAALAVIDPDHVPGAVDVLHLQPHHLGGTQPCRIGRRQRSAGLQARHRLKEPDHLVRTQHDRQLARLACIGNAFRDLHVTERDAVEEPQRADRLVQRRPRYPRRDKVDLKGPYVLQVQTVRRTTEIAAELRNRVQVGSLRRRRQIADCHVLGHAATQRAQLGHRGISCLVRWLSTNAIITGRRPSRYLHTNPAKAGSFNPLMGTRPNLSSNQEYSEIGSQAYTILRCSSLGTAEFAFR